MRRMAGAWMLGVVLALLLLSPAAAMTLRIGMQDDADTLDPAISDAYISQNIFSALCDKLIDLDAKAGYQPVLATGWQLTADAKALTLRLRPGVTFQNGETFDGDAVAWNIARYKDIARSRHVAEGKPITGVSVLDAQTVRIELAQPYAPLLSVLSNWYGFMVAPKAAAAAGKDFGRHPVCVGPYAFDRQVAQDRTVLRRSAGYWNPAAQGFDEVQYVTIPDATVRLANLRAGQIDIIDRPAPTDLAAIRADPHLRLHKTLSLGFRLMTFNLNKGSAADNPMGRDRRVREAFEASIDRDTINQVVYAGENTPDNQTEAPGSTFFNPDVPVPRRDLDRARALLREAGVAHPSFTLMVPNNPTDAQLGEVMQSMAAEAGFDVKVRPQEAISLYAQANRGDFQAIVNMWSGRPDPDGNLAIWLACDGFLNRGQYCNPELDRILAQAAATDALPERVKLYRQAVAIYTHDRPFLFLYHYTWFWGTSEKLAGFVPYPDGIIRLKGTSLVQ